MTAVQSPDRDVLERWIARLGGLPRRSPPIARGDRLFYTERGSGERHPSLWMCHPSGTARLIDPARWNSPHPVWITDWSVSPDGRRITFRLNRNRAAVLLLDIATGRITGAPKPELRRPVIASCGSGLRTVLAADPEAVVRHLVPLDGMVAVARWRNGRSEVVVVDSDSGAVQAVPLPGVGTVSGMTGTAEGQRRLWIGYAEPTRPGSVLEVDLSSPRHPVVRDWYRPDRIGPLPRIRRLGLMCVSAAGAELEISVLRRANGTAGPVPTVLSFWGGVRSQPRLGFDPGTLTWVLAGGAHAVARARGESADLVAAAECLVNAGLAHPDQLAVIDGPLASAAGIALLAEILGLPLHRLWGLEKQRSVPAEGMVPTCLKH
ncbi:MAG: Prolyl oligopeptidase [Nocardia sp.]|uniref:hypothetical protein n=1 Tax=Nocardia sp. TaxID=1821 RepID=UPI0026324692|nr:hypothetical protein [Nocardia sp.]MCU1640747.1 Prolyl oligopeptidase [Nocardia sp.]